MNAAFEAFLAKIYTDPNACQRCLINPYQEAERAGLTHAECEAVSKINPDDLRLAARSFQQKRNRITKKESRHLFKYIGDQLADVFWWIKTL